MASTQSNSGLVDLNRDRQILTRLQNLRIRRTFPFLDLPPELRVIVYELCIDLSTIEGYFDRYYRLIRNKEAKKKAKVRKCYTSTPSILLINRQIFSEAISLLSKQTISFHHGLFGLHDLTKAVSLPVLQQVSTINITVTGHHIVQSNILRESWSGYMDLLVNLSSLLATGHNLKALTIDLDDPELTVHTTACWDAGPDAYKCDFRDHMAEAFDHLRSIRGVGTVTLKGFPPSLVPELKARMESKPIHFLSLPGEIRNKIYTYAANPNDINIALNKLLHEWTDRKDRKDRKSPLPIYPSKTTPTILLLNKRITSEALPLIRSKTLTITFPAEHPLPTQPQVPLLTGFISAATLQQIQHLNLHLPKWEWVYAIEPLIAALGQQHKLKSFHLDMRDSLKTKFLGGIGRYYPDKALHESLSGLKAVRGVEKVMISGDLPKVYAEPLMQIMRMPVEVGLEEMPKLMCVTGSGMLVDVDACIGR